MSVTNFLLGRKLSKFCAAVEPIKTIQSSCHVGTLQKKAHITLTGITFFHITMDRNKRNSIAGFPMRPERINEDRDGVGGVGVGDMGMNPPSQVSRFSHFRIKCISHVQSIHYNIQGSCAIGLNKELIYIVLVLKEKVLIC